MSGSLLWKSTCKRQRSFLFQSDNILAFTSKCRSASEGPLLGSLANARSCSSDAGWWKMKSVSSSMPKWNLNSSQVKCLKTVRYFIFYIYIRHTLLTKKARRSALISLSRSAVSWRLFLGDWKAFSVPLWSTSVFLMALAINGANSFASSFMLNWLCPWLGILSFPLDDSGTCGTCVQR